MAKFGKMCSETITSVSSLLNNLRQIIVHCILVGGLFLLPVYSQNSNEKSPSQQNPISHARNLEPWIIIERSRCYGTCPAYRVSVFSDGNLVYEGFDFVKVEGRADVLISKEQVRVLQDAVSRAKYFKLQGSYGFSDDGCTSQGSDYPTVETTVRTGTRTKSVKHYTGCIDGGREYIAEMKRLTAFEDKIDDIINIEQWIGTEEERRKFEFLKRIN